MTSNRRRSINYPMLLRVMGWLLMIEAAFMVVPLAVAIAYREADWQAFAISAAFTGGAGIALHSFVRPVHTVMGKREGFLLTAMVWIVFSLFGMLPFLLGGTPQTFTDSFFEAVSDFTTTGASFLAAPLSHAADAWRATMQWVGGMGIILFTLAVIPMLNSGGGMQMFNAEVTGITHDKLSPRISQTAKSLWGLYGGLTIACTLLLWAGPMDFFTALVHAMGAVSTGGFSTASGGVSIFSSDYVDVVVGIFMFLGGVNFALIFRCMLGEWGVVRNNSTLRFYLSSIGICFAVFVIAVLRSGCWESWQDVTIRPMFMVISALTSTGYAIDGLRSWGPMVLALMLVMIFFGGCAGSTSGGAKLDRLLVLLKFSRNEVKRALQPNNITSVRMGGKAYSPELVDKVVAFLCLYAMIVVFGGFCLSAMGISVGDSFFSALSCMSNAGICTHPGIDGWSSLGLPVVGKWILAALMVIGRLEVFTILVLFSPNFWHR